ncbi:MAG: RNA-binding protein [Pseudomonadota bacterium]
MKEFELTPAMLTMGGVFYPKGYAFIMFADAQSALQVATEIEGLNAEFGDIMLLSPATVLRQIGKVDGESDIDLPSVGTEGATVNKYVQLARKGHHALMVQIPSDEHAEHLMVAARKTGFAYAQRYHLLAMEDLE